MSLQSHNLPSCCVLAAFLGLILSAQSCRKSKPKMNPLDEHVERVKKLHSFEMWAGKTKMVDANVDKLTIDEEFFAGFSRETTIYTKESERGKGLNVKIRDIATGLDVDIDIGVLDSPLVAHERVIRGLAGAALPPPIYKRADPTDPNDPLNIGDVCFGPARPWIPEKCDEPVLRSLIFSRNNILVHLRNSLPDGATEYPDLREIALLIDQKLKAMSKPNPAKKK